MERVCFLLRVRNDRLEEYRRAHQSVWPEMLAALREAGWSNYSLFLAEEGLIVGYLGGRGYRGGAGRDGGHRGQRTMAGGDGGVFHRPRRRRVDEGMVRLPQVFRLD